MKKILGVVDFRLVTDDSVEQITTMVEPSKIQSLKLNYKGSTNGVCKWWKVLESEIQRNYPEGKVILDFVK